MSPGTVTVKTKRLPPCGVKETAMDLIDLYHRRGVSLVRSKLASTPAARRGYTRLARLYAERIELQRVPTERREMIELTTAV
jgi:hypothetical protein